jgi:O-antigen ligase
MSQNQPKLLSLPFLLIYAEIVLFPLTYARFTIFNLPLNIIEVLVLLSVMVLIIERLRNKRELSFRYLWPCLFILLGLSLSTILMADLIPALGIIKGWFVIPMLFGLVVSQTVTSDSLRYVIVSLVINIGLVSFYTILQYLGVLPLLPHQLSGGDLQQYVNQGRALAYFESPNFIAMYLIPPIIFLAYVWKEKGRYYLPILLLPLSAVYLSRSRAGIVALLIVLSLIALSTLYKKSRWATAIGAVVAAGIIAFYLATHVTFSGADTLRLGIWKVALNLIAQHPLVGIGPGQFLEAFQSTTVLDTNLYQTALQYALHPHNIFLNFWLSGGVLAIGGFIWLLYQIYYQPIVKSSTIQIAAKWAIGAILIHGLFDSTYFKGDLALVFWLFAALIVVWEKESFVFGRDNHHEHRE